MQRCWLSVRRLALARVVPATRWTAAVRLARKPVALRWSTRQFQTSVPADPQPVYGGPQSQVMSGPNTPSGKATTFDTANPNTVSKAPVQGDSITEQIKSDHRTVEGYFDRYSKATADSEKQTAMWHIIRDLSVHSCVEEEVLYPLLKDKLGAEGVKHYEHSIKEHSELKKLLHELDQLDANPKDSKTSDLMSRIESSVKHHVKEEEEQVLPLCQKMLGADKLKELGKQYCDYKPMMPTRPHPDAPIASYVGDRAMAVVDWGRDKLRFQNVKGFELPMDPGKVNLSPSKPTTHA